MTLVRLGIGGPVGSGKTRLVERLLPVFAAEGISTAVITNDDPRRRRTSSGWAGWARTIRRRMASRSRTNWSPLQCRRARRPDGGPRCKGPSTTLRSGVDTTIVPLGRRVRTTGSSRA